MSFFLTFSIIFSKMMCFMISILLLKNEYNFLSKKDTI